MSEELELIYGLHSIKEAINNPRRSNKKVYATEEGLSALKKGFQTKENYEVEIVSTHMVQEIAKKYFIDNKLEYQRAPSQVILFSSPFETYEVDWLYNRVIDTNNQKILCLDQITDVHNGAAIMRSASFFGIDIIVIPSRKSFGFTPTFYRIASGATESLNIVHINNLGKTLTKLKGLNTFCVGLSEHADNPLERSTLEKHDGSKCLVLGKEETGISNAVMRVLDHQLSLESQGEIKSLNVSVAAAVSMQKCFGI